MLLDTSGLLCLIHKSELFHENACESYRTAHARITHNYILAEFIALSNARRFPRQPALAFISDLINDPDIESVWVDKSLNDDAIDLLTKRLDKTYSLCDAVSFVLMRERKIADALTTDRHFEQENFNRLLK